MRKKLDEDYVSIKMTADGRVRQVDYHCETQESEEELRWIDNLLYVYMEEYDWKLFIEQSKKYKE